MSPEIQIIIQEKAYSIWEAEGRPSDRGLDHWLKAEAGVTNNKIKSNRKPRPKKAAAKAEK